MSELKDIKEFTKCREPFHAGMVFRSMTQPEKDMIITYVSYNKDDSLIMWSLINHKAFKNFYISKGKTSENTFPYASYGEGKHSSIRSMIKKYELELVQKEEAFVYQRELEHSEWITDEVKEKYQSEWDYER